MIGIYKITNKINGKSYIGQSINIEKGCMNTSGNQLAQKTAPLILSYTQQ